MSRIMESIFVCSSEFLSEPYNISRSIEIGVTHIIIDSSSVGKHLQDKFELLAIDESEFTYSFKVVPKIMDFVRKTTLYRGRLLFVEKSG